MSGKFALIIGNTEYIDPGLAQLTAPGKDAEDFARVLKDQEIGAFDEVKILLNQLSSSVIETIDEFFDQKKPDDLLVLYFSGHGVRDELGSLYLAVKNTIRTRLRSTAIKSDYIRDAMDQSRSKRQLLILDCCNSGAFPQGTKAELGGSMGMTKAFQGYGRFVLTASDATQFAWEGDKVIGETDNSLFTHFLVKGLEGEADNDGDGRITVDELYDYTFDQISRVTPKQTPTKSASKQEGEIILRQNMRLEDIKPVPLPTGLLDSIESPFSDVRLGAVQQLIKLLNGKNLGLVHSAREALKRIAENDDSRQVSKTAAQSLESSRLADQPAMYKPQTEEKRIAAEKADAERKAKEEGQRRAREKAKAEREARAEAKLKAKQEAEREARADAKLKAEQEAERLEAQRAEEERIILEKVEAERKAKEKARHLAVQEANRESLAQERAKARPEAIKKVNVKESLPVKTPWLRPATIGMVIIALTLCGFVALNYLAGIFGGLVATEAPVETEPPATEVIATEAPLEVTTEAPSFHTSTADDQATQDTIYNLTADAQATQDAESYYDPFNYESGNWEMGEWNKERWDGIISIDNDTFLVTVTQVNDGFSQRISFFGHVSADFDIMVDSLSETYSETDGSLPEIFCHGIYFRDVAGSYFVFYICDQNYRVVYYDGSSWVTIIDTTESAAIRMWDWNTLRVIALGSNFDLYINDVYIDSFSDSRNEDGNIGLWFQTRTEKLPGQIRFDNFILNNY